MESELLINLLSEWHENLISELCQDDVLQCDDLCNCFRPACIVLRAIHQLKSQEEQIEKLKSQLTKKEKTLISAENALSIIEEQFDRGAFHDDYVEKALENWNEGL